MTSNHRRKWGIAIVIVASIAIIVAANFLRQTGDGPAVAVDATTVAPTEFEVTIVANGIVHAGDRHEIAATASGIVDAVHVAEGDRVSVGEPLLTLRQAELERAVERAALALRQAEARLAALVQVNEAPRTIDAERQNVALARLNLADAEQALADSVIRSTADGIVIRLVPKEGQGVSLGSVVAVIGRLDEVEVEANVDEVDIAAVQPGNVASVRSVGLPQTFAGEVRSIAQEAMPAQGQGVASFPVTIVVDNSEGQLRPGMNVQVDITTASRSGALVVPLVALHDRDGQTYVWVARDGKATEVPVTVGLRSQSQAEIIDGLAEGDAVISGPGSVLRTLQVGDRVSTRDSSSATTNNGSFIQVR